MACSFTIKKVINLGVLNIFLSIGLFHMFSMVLLIAKFMYTKLCFRKVQSRYISFYHNGYVQQRACFTNVSVHVLPVGQHNSKMADVDPTVHTF